MVESVELLILDASGHPVDRLALAGRTLPEGIAWVRERVAERLDTVPEWSDHRGDIPDAPVGRGQPFGPATDAHRELGRWFGNAARLLGTIADADRRADPVLAWAHHFDIATFLNLDPDKAQYEGRSINVGWSPGDATIPEPYFYVVAYPAPEVGDLPRLGGFGVWHAEGWVGAVMGAGEIVARSPEGQGPAVVSFIQNAMSILERKLTEERE